MAALLLSRAIARIYPDAEDVIRIALCVNLRKALKAPLAHQSLVSVAMLEYKKRMREWSLDRQVTAYRGMTILQTQGEIIVSGLNSRMEEVKRVQAIKTDQERKNYIDNRGKGATHMVTATVSYIGRLDIKGTEKYIRDFQTLTSAPEKGLLIEMSAINSRFILNIMQPFSSPIYVNAFLKELEENGINYDLQSVNSLDDIPGIRLPWTT